MDSKLKGSLLTVTAAISWGLSGVSGQYLMEQGVHVNVVTSIRLLIAGILLTGFVALRDYKILIQMFLDKKTLLMVFIFSLAGLVLNQYAYLQAIHHTNAGTATVLQYTTPVLILIYMSIKTRVMPSVIEVLSIVLAILGTFIIATHGSFASLSLTPKGLFWGIFSAFTYAAYILIPVEMIKRWGSLPVIGLGMLFGGMLFPIGVGVWRYDAHLTPDNLLAYFGIVGIGTIVAYTLFLKGVSMVGAVKGSLLAAIEPIAAVFFSVVLMHETFYLIDLVGMLLILLAVISITVKDMIIEKRKNLKTFNLKNRS